MILAIDPGDVRIGVAMFSYDEEEKQANLTVLQIVDLEMLYGILAIFETMVKKADENPNAPKKKHTIVVENFRTDVVQHGIATFQWNEMLTSQVIGAVKYGAHRIGADVVIQENRVLHMGKKWCDLKGAKNKHIPDDVSAYIHGAYYMMQQRMIGSVDDILKFGQERMP